MKDFQQLIVDSILNEVEFAESKYPEWPNDVIHAAAIVGEESGELTRAALQYVYDGGQLHQVQKEAIQTAATCIRFLKALSNY